LEITVESVGDLAGDIAKEYYYFDENAEGGRGDPLPDDSLPLAADGECVVVVLLDGEEVASEIVTIDVKVDSTPPEILGVTGLEPVYDVGDTPSDTPPLVTCSATDDTSGFPTGTPSCTVTQPVTDEAGNFVVTATSTDVAGNTSVRTFAYSVVPACDPAGDAVTVAGDIVGCSAVANGDGTATVTLQMGAPVTTDGGIQYRLELSDDPNSSGSQVKWSGGKSTGKALKSVAVTDNSIEFEIELRRLGLSGSTLYWSAAIQDGTSGQPSAGFLDFAPDTGYFSLSI
jgi:hypothetical protein